MSFKELPPAIESASDQVGVVLDRAGLMLRKNETIVMLSYYEMKFIESLCKAKDNFLNRHDIARLLEWNPHDYESRALEKFISRLRSKIKKTFCFDILQCIRGLGYCLCKAVHLGE